MRSSAESASPGLRSQLLIDAGEFWPWLERDVRSAHRRVLVQAMSFEGDSAGLGLARALCESGAADRRVLVDSYTRHVVSDRFVHTRRSRRDAALQAEIRATREMMAACSRAGVKARYTNPMDRWFARYPARNHKKLIVADDILYLGGFNFCDHNFAWHDFMLRIEHPAAAERLARDFEETWQGRNARWSSEYPGFALWSLDGLSNATDFAPVFSLVEEARREILVVSAYLTFPFFGPLRRAARRGVDVRLIAPAENNKPVLRDYVAWEAQRSGIRLHLYPERMVHAKAMMVDRERLLIGSANFDFISYRCEQEILCRIDDPPTVSTFFHRVFQHDLTLAPRAEQRARSGAGCLRMAQLKLADWLLTGLERATRPRTAAPPPEAVPSALSPHPET